MGDIKIVSGKKDKFIIQDILQDNWTWKNISYMKLMKKMKSCSRLNNIKRHAMHDSCLKSSLRKHWTSLMVQWIRVCLPMQGTGVQSPVQENSTCCWAISPCTTTTEPALWSQELQLLTSGCPIACAPQEKPRQRQAQAQQLESDPCFPQLEKSMHSNDDSVQPKKKKNKNWAFLKAEAKSSWKQKCLVWMYCNQSYGF